MPIISNIVTWLMKKRIHQMELFMKYPGDVQIELLFKLLDKASDTEWGKKYDYPSISTIKEFQERVPISTYEELFPYIDRLMHGEQNLLWPTKINWFAKSSGTTNSRSKFIPVSPEALDDCHYKGGKDMLSLYVNNFPHRDLLSGKGLSIGGSHQSNPFNQDSYYGDVSAVIMANLPFWAQFMRTPNLKTALMDKWEDKLERMISETVDENVTSLSGVPTWTLILLERILEKKNAESILEVWPNLELFVHGAVAFDPYRANFQRLIPSDQMNYLETYSASEGFFGIQDDPSRRDMMLMLDYGIFYEFIPMDQIDAENPKVYTIEEVELGKNYAVVITTNAGLWRYKIGDTVRFTSTSPYRIKISGRTKHFINAFGEEVIVENADAAIKSACEKTSAVMANYTAAPVYFGDDNNAGHEWIIEFKKEPSDLEKFTRALDEKLREINSDYDAKRQNDIALKMPIVHQAPTGTFYRWLEKKGKLGGQYKVPRLSNTREYIDEIATFLT